VADNVLVTGGSGYIAGWCVARLLAEGYDVRATVRNLARVAEVRRSLSRLEAEAAGPRLSFVAADLERDEGWDAAARDCRYVLHVASPLEHGSLRDPQSFIRPAREGALRALNAAARAGVERVVMTSSVAAVNAAAGPGVYDETHWTDPRGPGVLAYAQSKTLAERAAWDFIAASGGKTTLATVLPSLVMGPVTGPDYSMSVLAISRLLKGEFPGLPNFGFSYVDVRDVADLHLRAMTNPNAAGQRFIAASDFIWYPEAADMLRQTLGTAAKKIPSWRLPDWLVRLVALFDSDVKAAVDVLSVRAEYNTAKARDTLGWAPRPAREAILDCARSLIELGLV